MEFLNKVFCPVTCMLGEDKTIYENGMMAYEALKNISRGGGVNLKVSSISVKNNFIAITLYEDKSALNDLDVDWVREHIAQFGIEPNIFD